MENNFYNDPQWKEKRLEIMNRDDYTCCDCGTFSLSFENSKLFIHPGAIDGAGDIMPIHEIHEYKYWSGYSFQVGHVGITFDFVNSFCYLKFPTLQVHHKRYIEGRMPWEYNSDDLITLCKACHKKRHLLESIYIYNNLGVKNQVVKSIMDIDDQEEEYASFEPWTLIKKSKNGNYELFDDFGKLQIKVVYLGVRTPQSDKEIYTTTHYFIQKYLFRQDIPFPPLLY